MCSSHTSNVYNGLLVRRGKKVVMCPFEMISLQLSEKPEKNKMGEACGAYGWRGEA